MSYDPLAVSPLVIELGMLTTSDPNSRLAIPLHESDVSIHTSTMGFRLTITGGANALAATDIYLFPSSLGGKAYSTLATEMQSQIRTAIGGSPTLTVSWDGARFVIDAKTSTTAITVAAPSSGTSLTTLLFGGTTDQDGVATTWTGAAPRDLGLSGAGNIEAVISGSWASSTVSALPRGISTTSVLRDLLGREPTSGHRVLTFVQKLLVYPGINTDYQTGSGVLDGTTVSSAIGRSVAITPGTSGTNRRYGVSRMDSDTITDATVGSGGLFDYVVSTAALHHGSHRTLGPISSHALDSSGDTLLSGASQETTRSVIASGSLYPFLYWRRTNASNANTLVVRIRCSVSADIGLPLP